MKRLSCLLVACLLLIAPARALSPGCDRCSDLADLYRELLEQEFLLRRFDRWIREQYFPVTVEEMQRVALRDLNTAMSGDFFGVLGAPGGGGSGDGATPVAAPAYGTDMSTKDCRLVEYTTGKDGKTTTRPVTPEDIRKKHCTPMAEYLIAHEGHHQQSCRAAWSQGKEKQLQSVGFFVQDDRDSYQAGVAVLRKHIAELARRCAWSGSTSAVKPDGTQVVPTPQQVGDLQRNTAARGRMLRRASK
ncbi:MAG: hypothetical protein JNK67_18230 [Alphaproteobacteria bacterium]|nr:hypothetical protein [Alphaproteobacteria bacterium]